MRLEEPNGKMMWIPKTGVRFLITGENFPRKAGHIDLEHSWEKIQRYSVAVNPLEGCKIWGAPGGHY